MRLSLIIKTILIAFSRILFVSSRSIQHCEQCESHKGILWIRIQQFDVGLLNNLSREEHRQHTSVPYARAPAGQGHLNDKVIEKVWWTKLGGYKKPHRRLWNVRPMVEIGTGSFKSETEPFNPNKLSKDLKTLLILKEKMQENKITKLNPDDHPDILFSL